MNKINKVTTRAIKKTYQFYAPIYDLLFGASLEPGRRALSDEVRALKPNSLLEIGVGTGLLLNKYPIGTKVTGIDISEEMLEKAKTKANSLEMMNISLELMDAEELTYPDNHFDCVVLPYVLSVTPNPSKLILETRRVCKQNGTILIANHFSGSGFWSLLEKIFQNMASKIGFRTEFSYHEHITNVSWKIINVKSVNLLSLSKLITIKNVK